MTAAVSIGFLLAACGGGGGGGSAPATGSAPPPSGGSGGTGGTQVAPTAIGDTFGSFEVEVPDATSFLIHGTLPLAPKTFPRPDGQTPFAILDYDSTPVACQVEVVSWYPTPAELGADVVELIARVRRDPSTPAGTRVRYDIVVGYTPGITPPVSVSVTDLINGPVNVQNTVVGLLSDTASIEIATRDVFDNRYSLRPLEATGGIESRRYGDLQAQVRTYGTMRPDSPKSGSTATLSHMMGIHAYISSFSNEHVVLMDLRFNNGPDGLDTSDTIDDPNGNVYWNNIEIVVPTGWVLLQTFDDPFWNSLPPQITGSETTYKLVEPLPGNALHMMPWQSQFHRRLALCPSGFEQRARALLAMEGLAFCRRGIDSDTGETYFSWWNTSTARYFPQSFMLPSLEHEGLANIRSQLSSEFNTLLARIETGSGTGSYPISSPVLGWAHPYGVSYGGMTGGDEIHIWEGVRTAESASLEGYRQLQLTHRMHTDRMPDVLYRKDGNPTRVTDWVMGSAPNQFVNFAFYQLLGGSSDPFGSKNPPTFQTSAVATQNRQPAYEAQLLGYDPHDLQHLIRYTRSPKVLAWLGNDALAKDDIEMQAEICRLSYHQFMNGSFGYVQGTGLLADRQYADMYPGTGFTFGRGEGWSIDVVNAAYAMGDSIFRDDFRPWYDFLRDVLVDGQANCSGFLQANISPKFLSGNFRARQAIEQAIAENAIRGMVQSVYFLNNATSVTMLEDVLEKSYYSWFNVMSWSSTLNGPWAKAAVGPLNLSLPVWCDYLPTGGSTTNTDTYQLWSSLAYGNNMTSDPIFFQRAVDMLGGSGSLLGLLEAQGTGNISNQAALLALIQIQNAVF